MESKAVFFLVAHVFFQTSEGKKQLHQWKPVNFMVGKVTT